MISYLFLSRFPFTLQGYPDRKEDKFNVKEQRLFLHIEKVIPEFISGGGVIASINLRHPGQPGPHLKSPAVISNLPGKLLNKLRPLSARPHKTHIALQDIPELGQFIHCRRTENPAYFCHPWVMFRCPDSACLLLGIRDHGAEFIYPEHPAVSPDPLLRIEDRPPVLKPYQEGDKNPE